MSDVFINSKYIGQVDNAQEFMDKFLSERRIGKILSGLKVEQLDH